MIIWRRHSESKQKLEKNVPTKKLRRQIELHLHEYSPKSRIWKVWAYEVIVITDSTYRKGQGSFPRHRLYSELGSQKPVGLIASPFPVKGLYIPALCHVTCGVFLWEHCSRSGFTIRLDLTSEV